MQTTLPAELAAVIPAAVAEARATLANLAAVDEAAGYVGPLRLPAGTCPECFGKPCTCDRVIFRGLTYRQLRNAWDAIKPADWRGPVMTDVDFEELAVTAAAVAYFTATELKVAKLDFPNRRAYIHADGYRRGPAGDH